MDRSWKVNSFDTGLRGKAASLPAAALFVGLAGVLPPAFSQTHQSAVQPQPDSERILARSRLGRQSPQSGLIDANIKPAVRPQDDLFRHANGNWLDKVAIPDDRARWGIYEMMGEETLLQLRGVLDESASFPQQRESSVVRQTSLGLRPRVQDSSCTPSCARDRGDEGSDEQKARALYASFMDRKRV